MATKFYKFIAASIYCSGNISERNDDNYHNNNQDKWHVCLCRTLSFTIPSSEQPVSADTHFSNKLSSNVKRNKKKKICFKSNRTRSIMHDKCDIERRMMEMRREKKTSWINYYHVNSDCFIHVNGHRDCFVSFYHFMYIASCLMPDMACMHACKTWEDEERTEANIRIKYILLERRGSARARIVVAKM